MDAAPLQAHRAVAAQKAHKRLVDSYLKSAQSCLRDGGRIVISINPNPAGKIIGEAYLLKTAAAAGLEKVRDFPFEDKREHEYVVRYGDDRDLSRRRTYTKRSIRTYEFQRRLGGEMLLTKVLTRNSQKSALQSLYLVT